MKKILTALSLSLLFTIAGFTQTPTPTPVEDEDVVKISTNLIQIDVTVTDKKGNPVKDLKPEDFEIYENGKKQEITNFNFVSNVRVSMPETRTNKDEKLIIPTPTVSTQPRPEQVRRTIALVVDDFNLSFTSINWVKQALKRYVDRQVQPGDLVAIIRTSSGVGALQQFTSDRRQLYAAIENIRWTNIGSGNISTFEAVRPTTLELLNGVTDSDGNTSGYGEQIENEARNQQTANDFRNSVFATAALGSISFIIRGMQKLPGRKSIMLLSDGFPMFIQRKDGKTDMDDRVSDEMRKLTELANRASVVIYTMDAKGLETTGFTAEDDLRGKDFNGIEQVTSQRRMQLREAQDSLRYLALETGGIAVKNNNDINDGIRQMLDDQSYYLIGYQPDEETFDPQKRRFNKFEIKVKRDDVRVRYRSGFFGISEEQLALPTAVASKQTASQKLAEALVSPFAANEINLRLNALFGNEKEKGSFVRSFLKIEGENLQFTDESNGKKKASFDILAFSFNAGGEVVDQISKTYTITVDEPVRKLINERGMTYDFVFPVKKDGAYQMRVAVMDKTSGKIGSASQLIEIPNVDKDRFTLSGIVLENVTFEEWQKTAALNGERQANLKSFSDTANRQFKRGTVLNYGLVIYNAKFSSTQNPQVTTQIRIFRDGKVFFEGKPQILDLSEQKDFQRLQFAGSLRLGKEITVGDYILQVITTDNLTKRKIATQITTFEVIE